VHGGGSPERVALVDVNGRVAAGDEEMGSQASAAVGVGDILGYADGGSEHACCRQRGGRRGNVDEAAELSVAAALGGEPLLIRADACQYTPVDNRNHQACPARGGNGYLIVWVQRVPLQPQRGQERGPLLTCRTAMLHHALVKPGLDHAAALGFGLDGAGGFELPAGHANKALESLPWPLRRKDGDRRHRAMPAAGKLTLCGEEPKCPAPTRTAVRVDDRDVRGTHPQGNPRKIDVIEPFAVGDDRGGAASSAVPKTCHDHLDLNSEPAHAAPPRYPALAAQLTHNLGPNRPSGIDAKPSPHTGCNPLQFLRPAATTRATATTCDVRLIPGDRSLAATTQTTCSPCTGTGLRCTEREERSVLLVAYAFLVVATAWVLGPRRRRWMLRLSEPGRQQVRLVAGVLDAAVGALGVAVLGLQLGAADQAHVVGWTIGALVSLGAAVYAAGLVAWRGGRAVGLRILGWALMAIALVIPSTLTLALPLVALLATTLARLPERRVTQAGATT
jgi:hypothetical protein